VADWVVGLGWEDVPAVVRRSTVESVFQSVAGGVAGLDMPETQVALAVARAAGESGPATVLGDGIKVPVMTALFVNSVLWCSLEQQEMHVPSRTHPHEVIVPVAMVLAEQLHVDGVRFLEAVLAGVETTVALGKTAVEIIPAIVQGMPNTTSIFAGVGAAATAAKLLGLDAAATALALCHAANFGAGLTECLRQGTTEYHYSLGDASVKGLLAAQLAAAGAEAATNTFEGGSGLYASVTGLSAEELGDADVFGRVVGRLGREWGMPEHIYKRYPVHFPCLPFVDAAKTLRERHNLVPQDVQAIRLTINEWVALCDGKNLGPYTGREASRGAAAFVVAMMLARGRYGHDEAYELDAPDVMALVARTSIDEFEDKSNDCWELVRVEVVDKQGASYVYDSRVEGIPDYRLPMSELRSLAEVALGRVLDATTVSTVLDALQTLDTCQDVATLIPLLVRSS
jgi:2-methylcitrate dehydratase PrpD